MWQVALKMLMGDRAKYLGLVFGIMFASFMMSQQVSIFVGLMANTANQIYDVTEADIWVMDPQVTYIDEIKALPDTDLLRVRSVPGVAWAVPFFKGLAVVRAPGGIMQQVIVMGVDDATLIGRPPVMELGRWEDLRQPDAMMMDSAGFAFIWPGEPIEAGRLVEINDTRIRIVGISRPSPPFLTFPIVHTTYSTAQKLVPGERNKMSFVLVKAAPGQDPATLARAIQAQTGLQALTRNDFAWRSINYYLTRTGIPINFGITVFLGFLIGAVIAGQTFYLFIIENLKQFGALKAIGVHNTQLLTMVLLQAAVVGGLGYSLGIGGAATFFALTADVPALRGFMLHGQVAAGTFAAVMVILVVASVFSIRRAMVIDPAIVFRG
jgi:putative ABC transport system permease protein